MLSKIIVLGWTGFIAWSFLSGLTAAFELNPSDSALGLAVFVSAIGHFALWALVAMPTYIISRMSARRTAA